MTGEKPPIMPVTENTPLLIVPVRERPPRYPHATLRRVCTISLTTLLVVALILFLLPVAILPSHGSIWQYMPWSNVLPHSSWPLSLGVSYQELQQLLHDVPSEDKAREWSSYYTSGPHLAGKNLSQALWTREKWRDFGVSDTSVVAYDVYINYPVDHRLALLRKKDNDYEVEYEASLEEDVLDKDSTSGLENRIPTFHGYSATGNVTAQYVYANHGTYQDYETLVNANVSLEGKIALVKYGHTFRGLAVKRAQELGMVGVLIYSDPQQDWGITEENGYKPYPDGPARQPSSVQRGSVQFLSMGPGDPTTPGWASKPDSPREDPHKFIPSIPSLPISYQDALPLLKALNGHGPKAIDLGEAWDGGLGYKGVEYNIGPSPEDMVLNLYNEQEYVTTPLWNVIGVIKGSIPDEVVVLGNHRDAWVAGGAGDPNSGSAVLNEVVRSFGEAMKYGWKPLRTVVFASWDGEEYGLIGSTEWVEDNISWLSKKTVAYLNVDVAAVGGALKFSASPMLNKAIYEATGAVQSPNQTIEGQTVRDVWGGHISPMGSGSDFTAFQDFAGIPSADFSFKPSRGEAVYHYHSNYDSFDWMDNFGDKGWHYHVTSAKIWSLMAAYLVEKPVLGLNVTDYADGLAGYLDKIRGSAIPDFSFKALDTALSALHKAAVAFDAHTASLAARLDEELPWWQYWKKIHLFLQIRAANNKYKVFEREFLHNEGLDGRPWFKHVVFAPGLWTGYAGIPFPGLAESFDDGDRAIAEKWSDIIVSKINSATHLLRT